MFLVKMWLKFLLFTILLQATSGNEVSRKDKVIIGGRDAKPGEFPYMVSVQMNSGIHHCGGSIITDEWILSAAHCFDESAEPLYYTVLTGTIKINSDEGKRYWVKKIIIHPLYTNNTHDIALLQLRNKISFDSLTFKIKLPTWVTSNGTEVVLTGWGRTRNNSLKLSEILQTIVLLTITNQKCQEVHDRMNTSIKITDNEICTFTKKGEGACHADSGGPVVDPNLNIQVGIVSGGIPCARGIPDHHTRVYKYLDWINNEMSEC